MSRPAYEPVPPLRPNPLEPGTFYDARNELFEIFDGRLIHVIEASAIRTATTIRAIEQSALASAQLKRDRPVIGDDPPATFGELTGTVRAVQALRGGPDLVVTTSPGITPDQRRRMTPDQRELEAAYEELCSQVLTTT